MIASFGDSATADLFNGVDSSKARRFKSIAAVALRKLQFLVSARTLADLTIPPSNRLEALKGNLAGWYSIRLNSQLRIIFQWSPAGASGVQIVDYH